MVTISFGPFDLLAVIGAVTGIGALVWQMFTWRRLGHRVKVTSSYVIPIYGDTPGDNDQVCVTAHNHGTSAVTITNWGIKVADNQHAQMTRVFPSSDTIPHRLEPGAEANFYFPVGELRDYNARTGFSYDRMRPYVKLATRQTIVSRKGVPLAN
jgi:hypothetical protein